MATLSNNTNNVMAQDKKYILLENDTIIAYTGRKLYRIQAVRDFGDVKSGDLGGYIQGEHNLSHEGTCWVSDNARVFGEASVWGDAQVCDNARVSEETQVYGNARVCGHGQVWDFAQVYGNARVCDNARVCGHGQVWDFAQVSDYGKVYDDAQLFGHAQVCGDAQLCGRSQVGANERIGGIMQLFNYRWF